MINFAISSNVDFYKKTIPVIVPSLLRQGYKPENIWVFIGDENKNFGRVNHVRACVYNVPIRAFEFTAAIGIMDYFPDPDRYWFLMHDTCVAGPNFRALLESKIKQDEVTALNSDGLNNMGLCCTSYLLSHKSKLESYRGYSVDKLLELKRKTISEEGWLFRGSPSNLCTRHRMELDVPTVEIYGTENRKLEYWEEIDLYKYKSNYVALEDGNYNLQL